MKMYVISIIIFVCSIVWLTESHWAIGIFGLLVAIMLPIWKFRMDKLKNSSEVKTPSNENGTVNIVPLADKPKSTSIYAPRFIDDTHLYKKYDDVKICIIKGNEPDYNKLNFGREIDFRQEPNNEYDNTAVALFQNDLKIGYLYKGTLKDMVNDWIARNDCVVGWISSIDAVANTINITLAFYKTYSPSYVIKLTLNKSNEIQSNIDSSSEGDEVSVEYDYDSDSYCVYNYDLIGYVPKSKSSIFEDNECDACIARIEFNDETEKSDVYINVVIR